ncbi:hypothetical protein LAZ67_3005268 [Cordylochernes scorpioides]|uniref:ATP-dependent DNA helicase n=1 Tax=Cordylochernes scorpioides TaxID=51811 RepID=A0ABY6KAF7_9ARAC|nr:hypothetical protein LAZ67_3005268 [Cordylochernes scorpioides]
MPRRGRGRLAYRTRHGNNAPNPISPVPTEYIIGGLDIVCPYCSALHFPGETVGSSCCHKGKVILPTLSSFPYEMMELMTSNSVEAKYFQTNIRSYNSSLAFASMGAQVDVFSGQGPFCYRIHGQIYHLTGPLHPHGNRAPSYAQLYILDSEAANNTRIAASRPLECHPGILTLLDSVLRRVNPYTSAYRQMRQVELAEEHRARIENRQMCQVQMLIRQNHCRDLRRYNAPSVSEIAAIFVDQDGHVPSNRDIAVFPHDCGLVRISPLNPNCDPMTYPLLFPAGDPGWAIGILHEENMRTSTRNHVTMLQFYSYRLAIRPGFSPIHYGRRLFQQYVVDAYVKTEGNRLNYIRQNQSLLRVELYQGLLDYIHEQEHSRGVRIGRIFILPSSFPGSSRAMQQNYQDAMAIVRKFGRPDLFVTFTCNPRWTDIVENLLPNQNPSDRPDLVARVFNLKLQQLLHEIVSQHVLGVVIARVHVVEFQKRGLPHAHMLFMLREEDKPRDRDAIDMLVCAEIPSPTMQVQLYDMVRKHMIHGPCGNFNLHSPCMSDGKCTKDFPKSFLQLTEANNNGYPRYRRRDDGQTLVVGTHEVDNRWVVPYNPYLLVRFNAHINVEVCASVKSVKYLFKYVYKGHDRAEVEVSVGELDMESRAHDEIKNFLDARYVSAPEAMWRMFEYRLHAHSHTICRLAVHLPNFQSVYFVEGSEEQALENASRRRTTLTAWFQLNCVNVSARSLLYGDIPSAYVFRQNQWSARVRGGALCIGRMCSVNPKDSERYHLRLLLLHVAGAQSFEDLRTVDDIVCSTFKEAAQRRGLLADDSEWDACLAEAALFQMPCQLRQLFATILIYNNPTDPVSLWTKYKGYLSEDFSRATSDAAAEQMTLRELEFQLRENRLSCHHYGLPAPLTPLLDSGEDHLDVNAELQIGTEMYRSLTPDQKSIVDTIVDSLNVNPRCFFIDGPGGTGKTYVYNTLIHCVRAVGKIVIPLASTGIAATLLSGGQTVHSRFKLPIPLLENSVAAISANSSEAELIRRSSLIIWDEAPMAHYRALEIVDRLLKDIMHCDLAFGGKVVVLGGDFRQVLPVVPRASRAEIVAACIKQSKLWPLFVILRLTQNMRAGIDAQSFSQWLLKVGDGDLPTDQQGLISLPESCIFHGVDLVQEIFGSSYGDITALSQSVILTPKNTDSLEINEKVLDRLPNRSQCFLSVDSVECENVEEQNNYPTEFLNSLTPTGMPPHRLNLKIGAIVMLLRNLNPKQGLCNGTRMVIQRMRSHVLEAQILTGTKVGQTVLVPKISLAPSDTNLPFILKRRQFPLRLAFAMTINKAQGQTFARVGLLLHEPVFTHGQLYVAFSRVRTLNSIRRKVSIICPQNIRQPVFININLPENPCSEFLTHLKIANFQLVKSLNFVWVHTIETLSEASSDITIILGEFNAKSSIWGSPVQDNKSQQTHSLEIRRQHKNNLDRHFGNEEPEDEISLTTCGLVDPPFSENEVKLTAFKFWKRKYPGPEGIDNTVVKPCVDKERTGVSQKKYLATRWYQYRVENPRTTLLELEQDTGISKTTIGKIVTEDLKLKKTPAKCIPRFLTNEQNLCRLATCEDMFKMTRTDPEWKDKIITGDETWVYGYDPETKRQSAEWRGQEIVAVVFDDGPAPACLNTMDIVMALSHIPVCWFTEMIIRESVGSDKM